MTDNNREAKEMFIKSLHQTAMQEARRNALGQLESKFQAAMQNLQESTDNLRNATNSNILSDLQEALRRHNRDRLNLNNLKAELFIIGLDN